MAILAMFGCLISSLVMMVLVEVFGGKRVAVKLKSMELRNPKVKNINKSEVTKATRKRLGVIEKYKIREDIR